VEWKETVSMTPYFQMAAELY